ncbi:hypothetical protein D1BOALGB6SA_1774 [Olavius sp. associated proteobacterium Delta 1]|nr:hypothetical protein D1BOALGB6SA_1774 [Olavius sp. associated proteobacterium Delta 1]
MISKRRNKGSKEQRFDSEGYGDDLQCVQEKYKSIFERNLHCIYVQTLSN